MKNYIGLILAALVVASLLVYTVSYQVDEFQDVTLIKTLGKVTKVVWGHRDPGLHFKWPWPFEKLVRYDARTHLIESPHMEVQTADQQHILLTVHCTWQIADPVRFHASLKTANPDNPEQFTQAMEEQLKYRLMSFLSGVVGTYELGALVNTDPGKMKLEEIEGKIFESLQTSVMKDYGVKIHPGSSGIKRLDLTEGVSGAVIDLQKGERQQYIKRFQTEGESDARAITERARLSRERIIAFANRKAAEIRAEGDREAAKIYNRFRENPQLATFLRSLESLKQGLKEKSVIILDGSEIEAIKFFRKRPSTLIEEGAKDNDGQKRTTDNASPESQETK